MCRSRRRARGQIRIEQPGNRARSGRHIQTHCAPASVLDRSCSLSCRRVHAWLSRIAGRACPCSECVSRRWRAASWPTSTGSPGVQSVLQTRPVAARTGRLSKVTPTCTHPQRRPDGILVSSGRLHRCRATGRYRASAHATTCTAPRKRRDPQPQTSMTPGGVLCQLDAPRIVPSALA